MTSDWLVPLQTPYGTGYQHFLPLWVVLSAFVNECQRLASKKQVDFCVFDSTAEKIGLRPIVTIVPRMDAFFAPSKGWMGPLQI